jgi:hypothetical protein
LSDNVKLTDIDFDQNEKLEDELLEKNRMVLTISPRMVKLIETSGEIWKTQ